MAEERKCVWCGKPSTSLHCEDCAREVNNNIKREIAKKRAEYQKGWSNTSKPPAESLK